MKKRPAEESSTRARRPPRSSSPALRVLRTAAAKGIDKRPREVGEPVLQGGRVPESRSFSTRRRWGIRRSRRSTPMAFFTTRRTRSTCSAVIRRRSRNTTRANRTTRADGPDAVQSGEHAREDGEAPRGGGVVSSSRSRTCRTTQTRGTTSSWRSARMRRAEATAAEPAAGPEERSTERTAERTADRQPGTEGPAARRDDRRGEQQHRSSRIRRRPSRSRRRRIRRRQGPSSPTASR